MNIVQISDMLYRYKIWLLVNYIQDIYLYTHNIKLNLFLL